ncbi:MAG: DUF1624 domain-containing protein [Candidatus Hodarchaeales archaeon]|jgi:uncharacterized membrane protein
MTRIQNNISTHRLLPIDFVRGIVIILMALDHASILNPYHAAGEGLQGARPVWPDIFNFLARFVTHYCAPSFIFLAGTSITLSTVKRQERGETRNSITNHLLIRGLILLIIEWTLISSLFGLFGADQFYFGVLACIGIGFIIFAFAHRLPSSVLLIVSISIILLSPFMLLFPFIIVETKTNGLVQAVAIFLAVAIYNPIWPYGLYPLIPWIGIMGLGVVFGRWLLLHQNTSNSNRVIAKRLGRIGLMCLLAFFILRIASLLDLPLIPIPSVSAGWPANYLSPESLAIEHFFLLAKYPPSIVFLLWTLGGTTLLMAIGFFLQDNPSFRLWMTPVMLLGATALFFYCAHITFYVLSSMVIMTLTSYSPPIFDAMVITLIVWLIGLVVLFPLCMLFQEAKKRYPTSFLKYI